MNRQIIKELEYLASMMKKYSNRYNQCMRQGGGVSARTYKWIDRYNGIKAKHVEEWIAHCEDNGLCPTHDAYDNFA